MTIHAIGDSHINILGYFSSSVTIYKFGPHCAYNLKNKPGLLQYIYKSVNKEKDQIILSFGEIDCRLHIFYQYEKQKHTKNISELIDDTVSSYLEALKPIESYNFAVLNIVPAGCWLSPPPAFERVVPTSIDSRKRIYGEFHDRLDLMCRKNNIKTIDVWNDVIDSNQHAKRVFRTDEVHLSRETLPFFSREIKKAFGIDVK